jgi:hypothetical protein
MRRVALSIVALAVPLTFPGAATAYDSTTTHPGLTTQALLASRLHLYLRRELGLSLGVFSRLAIDRQGMAPRDHRHMVRTLECLDPAGGYRPDEGGAQRAASWLLAGSVLAGMPASIERHHFYCPSLRKGLDNRHLLLRTTISVIAAVEGIDSVRQLLTGTGVDLGGTSALEWATSVDNPQGAPAFYRHLVAATSEATPARRDHHLALALLSMGGLLHLLQDMASPSHVRNDFVTAHLEKLGASVFDRGSAYERFVATIFGQFGLPSFQGQPVTRQRLLDYFSSPSWSGLADTTAVGHFSPGTLPPPLKVLPDADRNELRDRLTRKLPLSQPALGLIDVACAGRRTCYLGGQRRPLLAYTLDRKRQLRFFLDRRCHAAAARQLLPRAVAFSAGMIDFLLRGKLALERDGGRLTLLNRGVALVKGKARLLAEDAKGKRTPLREVPLRLPAARDATLATMPLRVPDGAVAIVALLEGDDDRGERVVAAIRLSLAPASQPAGPTVTTFSTPAPTPSPATRPAPSPTARPPRLKPRKRLPQPEPIPGKLPGKELRDRVEPTGE